MKIIGLDIGGTKISTVYAEYNDNVNIKDKIKFDTNVSLGLASTLDNIMHSIETLIDRHRIIDFTIGISCGGPLDAKTGTILGPPNLPGWDNVQIVDILKKRFDVEAFLQNDADACALAEWKAGAGQGSENLIFLTFGTGLGAGLILNGRLYSGSSGMAGEVGHIRLNDFGPVGYGKIGSFEGFCSGGGIEQLAKSVLFSKLQSGKEVKFLKDGQIDDITAKLVFEYADKGDSDALEIVKIVGEYLGKGLSILIDILNPEKIIIGSIYARNVRLLTSSVNEVIAKEALTQSVKACEVVPAQIGEGLGDYAATMTAVYGMEKV